MSCTGKTAVKQYNFKYEMRGCKLIQPCGWLSSPPVICLSLLPGVVDHPCHPRTEHHGILSKNLRTKANTSAILTADSSDIKVITILTVPYWSLQILVVVHLKKGRKYAKELACLCVWMRLYNTALQWWRLHYLKFVLQLYWQVTTIINTTIHCIHGK